MEVLLDPREREPRAARALAAVAPLTPSAMTQRLLELYDSVSGGRLPVAPAPGTETP